MINVAVVEPRYQVNLGYIARIMKNFGAGKLYLINPKCNYRGKQAIKYSKHAHMLLGRANVRKSISDIASGSFVIGTTGIWSKTGKSFHNVYMLQDAGKFLKRISSHKKILLLLGRDGTGLTKEELRHCDATIFIGADKSYPVLNISHALAIILFELTSDNYKKEYGFMERFYADAGCRKALLTLFDRLIKHNNSIRDKKSVHMAFEHVLDRAMPTKKEVNAIAIALSKK